MNRRLDDRERLVLSAIYYDIRQKAFFAPSEEQIIYKVTDNLLGMGSFISSSESITAIYTLQNEGVIKVLREFPATWSRRGTPDEWVIEVIQPLFKDFEKEFDSYSVSVDSETNSQSYTLRDRLLSSIPINRKTRHIKKMALLFTEKEFVSNFELAKCIKSSLSKRKYKLSQKKYDQEVQHRLRTLKKYWKKIGYTVKSVNTPGDGYLLQQL